MALVYTFSRDQGTLSLVRRSLAGMHDVAGARTWGRLEDALRERPASLCLLDLTDINMSGGGRGQLMALRRNFPSMAFVILESGAAPPRRLLELGRLGFRSLVLLGPEGHEWRVRRSVERAWEQTVASRVFRAVSPKLPLREGRILATALDQVHQCWSSEDLAEQVGLSRPFLSVLFKGVGLPSVGKLLVWIRLLHAAEWLGDPGRTGQSVSRQLEYSSGAAFRRVLKNYTGATPTQVVEKGGMPWVLRHFLRDTGFAKIGEGHTQVA